MLVGNIFMGKTGRWICLPLALLSLLMVLNLVGLNQASAQPAGAKVSASIKASLERARSNEVLSPGLIEKSIETTPVANVYSVTFSDGRQIYASGDGKYLLQGSLYEIQEHRLVNLQDLPLNNLRKERVAAIDPKDMVVFSPAGEVKSSITVFTDIDCGYCRKLHAEVDQLNDLGIEVKYLAYPRSGVRDETNHYTASFKKIASAWCAKDSQKALTDAKNGQSIEENICDNNPVAEQLMLGQQLGVNGTPALILEDGSLIPGYMPADRLARTLGIK